MPFETHAVSDDQKAILIEKEEGHFFDFKSKEITPARLSKTLSALANADGGEVYVGIRQDNRSGDVEWNGFANEEEANGYIQALISEFPPDNYVSYNFLRSENERGLVLQILLLKTPDIRHSSDGTAYVRIGAQNKACRALDALRRLEYDKGVRSYQDNTIDANIDIVANSIVIIDFALQIIPLAEPEVWLRKQNLIHDDKPRVAGVLLFADIPQAYLPKSGIKIYRYDTDDAEGTRQTLAGDPITVEGCAYKLIIEAVNRTVNIIETLRIYRDGELVDMEYPRDTIHEIVTNAVIHRDYSINDDIHVRIFNNRVEIQSPGLLPGHVTINNILDERFSRNDKIVRILNKFPNPPNKDVGEGLNTAFEAMRVLRLREPQIVQGDNNVIVYIRHEPLAGHEQTIIEYLKNHGEIGNAKGREICNVNSESVMRKTFQRMIGAGEIERVPGKRGRAAAYRLVAKDQ